MTLTGNLAKLSTQNILNLPRLPMPSLENTLQAYKRSVKPLAKSDAEYNEHCSLVNEFTNGAGPLLHQSLLEREAGYIKAGCHPYFFFEKYWDDAYLCARCPNPVHISPFYILNHPSASDTDGPSNAARYIAALLPWWQNVVEKGEVPPEKQPGDLSQLAIHVGTARIPRKGRDALEFHGGSSRHVVVQCGGKFFKVDVIGSDGKPASYADIRETFKTIFQSTPSPSCGKGVGVLTTEDRDVWAEAREQLCQVPENERSLNNIDSALWLVALDHGDATREAGPVSQAQSLLHGSSTCRHSPVNRWYDKHQIVVDEGGNFGAIWEHSFSDGATWNKALQDMWPAMGAFDKNATGSALDFSEIKFELSSEIEEKIVRAEAKRLKELQQEVDTAVLHFDEFGKNGVKKMKMSPDAFCQVALQAAYQNIHGSAGATYEACSMKGFFHGRTETIRSCTNESDAFAKALLSNKHSKEALQGMLIAASKQQSDLAKAAAVGEGIDRHLLGLKMEAKAHGVAANDPTLQLFDNPLYNASGSWNLSTSNVTAPFIKYFGFGPVTNKGYGFGYMTVDDHFPFCITSFRSGGTSARDMKESVHQTLLKMRDLF
ncbi:Choline O-acetyltransferase [Diplonema papillatum]|nr:Choline O-acetyltransferase [Diplonema papillatum]